MVLKMNLSLVVIVANRIRCNWYYKIEKFTVSKEKKNAVLRKLAQVQNKKQVELNAEQYVHSSAKKKIRNSG